MANSENSDMMSIGQHCAVPDCGQVDFLPFKCDCCQKTFCLEHRTYEAHRCPKAGSRQTEVIVCPLCARAIKLKPGEDANRAFEMHQRSGCDVQNYQRVHKKKKCPVANCKEKLTTINTYQCKDCGTEICLKHRLPADHQCKQIQAEKRMAHRNLWSAFPKRPAPSSSAPKKPTPLPQRNVPAHKEVCQQCGACFSSVQQLINHVDTYHPSGAATDRCPNCGMQFSSAVQLVQHVESRQCQRRTCAIS